MEVRIRRFDPNTIRDYSSILFAGGRRTGKSFGMRDILWHVRKRVYDAKVYSGTIDEDHPWEKVTPERFVHHCLEEFPVDAMKKDILDQERRKRLAKEHGAKCPASIMVFEDVEHLQPPIWKDQSMRALIFNGRWSKSFCFVAFQYIMEVKMAMRGSFDYAFFAMENSSAVRERIWKQFGGIFPTFKEFESVFFECTKDYRMMVIDCRARSYDVRDIVFWYKAKDRGEFRVGHPDVWRPIYRDSDSDSEDEYEKNARVDHYSRTKKNGGPRYEITLDGIGSKKKDKKKKKKRVGSARTVF